MTTDHSVDVSALTDRQREIVRAARRILETEGPAGVTMRRVAAELGIQAPSLYKHTCLIRALSKGCCSTKR